MLFTGTLYLVSVVFCAAELINYVSLERPEVLYYNPRFLSSCTVSSRRYSRRDPLHYFTVNFTSLFFADNNVMFHYDVYEFLTNEYKPSFVQVHYRLCDALHKNEFIGPYLKMVAPVFNRPCPYPPGEYNIANLSIPIGAVPKSFPFTKGRIYCNVTLASTNELLTRSLVDVELKQMKNMDKN